MSGRERILGRIREALASPTPQPFEEEASSSFFGQPQGDSTQCFETVFTGLLGKFAQFDTEAEALSFVLGLAAERDWKGMYAQKSRWQAALGTLATDDTVHCDASLTGCEAVVARTGSLLLSSHEGGRIPSVYAPVHICFAYRSQLVADIENALAGLQQKYGENLPSMVTLASGPSRTADIEKTLVVGVHGPKEVWVLLIDNDE